MYVPASATDLYKLRTGALGNAKPFPKNYARLSDYYSINGDTGNNLKDKNNVRTTTYDPNQRLYHHKRSVQCSYPRNKF